MRSSWRTGGSALLLSLLLSTSVGAQTTPAPPASQNAMIEQWRLGTVEYTLGHYETAVQCYERAYRLHEEPALLYNLAQAYRKLGALEQSLTTYRSYLLRAPPDAPNRALAHQRAQELETLLAARKEAGLPAPEPLALTPSRPAAPAPGLVAAPAAASSSSSDHHWWVWALVGALVAGGVTTVLVLDNRAQSPIGGTVGTATIP